MKTKVKSAMISAFKLERNQMQNSFLVKDRCTIDPHSCQLCSKSLNKQDQIML